MAGSRRQTLHISDWCGCTAEDLPVPMGDGWWQLVPIWELDQTVNPLFVTTDAAAYERFMGRWSQQLAPVFVDFVGQRIRASGTLGRL
jgi:hypothetical protein